jgi:hypothetical protein
MTNEINEVTPKGLINTGVVFEEKLIITLCDVILMTNEFAALNEEARNKIVKVLEILKKESEQHNAALKNIADKY